MTGDGRIVLRVDGLRKWYGEVHAVDGISFEVPTGTVFTILGPNGAGKTTTLEILEGIREPDAGTMEIFGEHLTRVDRATKQRMGVLLQEGNFEEYLRVREVLELFASFFEASRPVGEILELVALEDKARAYVKSLSGGQKQRLALGAALVNDPELVFLDEPTTGLDPQARRNIWSITSDLRSAGKTLILTTHYMEEAEALSDHVCIMDHGAIIASGSPLELMLGLGQETMVEFSVEGLEDRELTALAGCCKEFRRDGDQLTVETEDLVPTLESILGWSRSRSLAVRNMVVRQPNLEDVFLSLTGRKLRE
ncbi:MAG: ABC transporter ATP-binding protein [Candidatus Bipolaricaulota bacterium]|nr:MAG: ABC transporter ATP-binding protein [Candidatus Bipolaricaulota bacterium]